MSDQLTLNLLAESAPVPLREPPRQLPVGHLSVSSMALWMKCQERWRRRYVLNEFEPVSPAAMLGSAIGGAERDSWGAQIESGAPLGEREVLDAFSDGWALQVERATDTGGIGADDDDENAPARAVHHGRRELARVKDSGARVLPLYHRTVAPTVKPIAVERKFTVYPADVDWTFEGYLDVETEDVIPDLKARSRTKGVVSRAEARGELQPTGYLYARRAEGNPASRFEFHSLVRQLRGGTPRPADVAVTEAHRTEAELDTFGRLLYIVAAQIAFAYEYDVWTPAPRGAWWCSEAWCGFWRACPFGGLHSNGAAPHPRPARKPSASRVREAIEATASKAKGPANGLTTAAKVARWLGISTRSASGMLAAEVRAGRVESRPAPKSARGSAKHARHYAIAVRWPDAGS